MPRPALSISPYILSLDLGTMVVTVGIALGVVVAVGFCAVVVSIRRDDRRRVPGASPALPRRFRRRVLGTYTRDRAAMIRGTLGSQPTSER